MFFLSKLVAFLLNPLLWIILLIAWALLPRNRNKRSRWFISAGILFYLFSCPMLFFPLFNQLQARKVEWKRDRHFSAGILLGGFVSFDEKYGESYFNTNADRFIQAARLYRLGILDKIIICGGNGISADGDFLEARFAAANLRDLGIPEKDIIQENRSRNTRENAFYCKKIIDSLQFPPPYALITSAFHVARAGSDFRNAGIKVEAYPCAYLAMPAESGFRPEKLLPSARVLNLWPLYLKEILSLGLSRIKG